MKNYRTGFLLTLTTSIILALVLVGLWLHYRSLRAMDAGSQPADTSAQESGSTTSPARTPTETPLAPIQLSPDRLQSIGVTTGEAKQEAVEDEIRTTGNVAVDETRLAYVQIRFSGYIRWSHRGHRGFEW